MTWTWETLPPELVAIHDAPGGTSLRALAEILNAYDAARKPAPVAEWSGAWRELTGYVQQARDDGEDIDPAALLPYMGELRRKALAPVREWMRESGGAAQGSIEP